MVLLRVLPAFDGKVLNYYVIAVSSLSLVRDLRARRAMMFTATGGTAMLFSRMRPQEPLIAMTLSTTVERRLAMYLGVCLMLLWRRPNNTFDEILLLACNLAFAIAMLRMMVTSSW